MRVLALDIGKKRIGVASGDTDTRIATPVRVMPAHEVTGNARTWQRLLEDYEPELLICGLLLSMSGQAGMQARAVREQAQAIAQAAGLPLEFSDERLSSAQAKRYLREQGMDERAMRGNVDAVAASLFLETWLDARANDEGCGARDD